MQDLRSQTQAEFLKSEELNSLMRFIVASLFYFELESMPQYMNENILCADHILCWTHSGDPALKILLIQLSKSFMKFTLQDHILSEVIEEGSFINRDGNFQKQVELTVSNWQQRIFIHLEKESSPQKHISDSSFTIDFLIAAQDLKAHFGWADHKKRKQQHGFQSSERKRQWVMWLNTSLYLAWVWSLFVCHKIIVIINNHVSSADRKN